MLDLRNYQVDAIDAIDAHEAKGKIRPLCVIPTGGGKTVVFSHHISRRGGRALVFVHRDELAEQAVEKLRIVDPDRKVGIVKAEMNEVDAETVVASVQTAQLQHRMDQLLASGPFRTVVVDEAHHAPAPSWRYCLDRVGSLRAPSEPGPLTVGFTATPERDGKKLEIWDGPQPAYYLTIRELVFAGYLAPVRGERVKTSADLTKVSKSDGDLAAGQLGTELLTSGAIGEIARAINAKARDRKGVAFLPTIATAKALAEDLRVLGIAAESVDGNTPKDERRAILKRLRSGVTRWVANCAVLTEGFDEPSIDCICIARPTVFHGLYVQMVGRGMRPFPGKEDCLVLDVVGATERHDLVSTIDLGANDTPGQGSAMTHQMPDEMDPRPCQLCGRRVAADRWDVAKYHENCEALETGAIDLFKKSTLRWLPLDRDNKRGWAMPIENGVLVVAPADDERYHLINYERTKLTFVNHAVPLEWAFGIGEDRAKAFGNLTKRKAGWLTLRPTPRQLNALDREGVPRDALSRIKTRGQAADLMTRLQGRRAVAKLERQSC